MQKVISINLNGNAYQLDESGYDDAPRVPRPRRARSSRPIPIAPRSWRTSSRRLPTSARTSRPAQVASSPPARSIRSSTEMGPVDGAAGDAGDQSAPAGQRRPRRTRASAAAETAVPHPRRRDDRGRLQRARGLSSRSTSRSSGSCSLVAAFVTKGVGIIAYVVMMFVIPEANTPEERAAAGGRAAQRQGRDRPREEAVCGGQQAVAPALAAAAPPLAPARLAARSAVRLRSASLGRAAAAGIRDSCISPCS